MAGEPDIVLPRTRDLELWCVSLLPVIVLLIWDIWKAWKRRAIWIPGEALLLSSIIIYVLSFIDYSHLSLASPQKEVRVDLKKNDSGRMMMCVLIAYLLPGMARSSSVTDGINLFVLGMSIVTNILNEESLSEVNYSTSPSPSPSLSPTTRSIPYDTTWSIPYDSVLYTGIVYLLGLMAEAVLMGRSSRKIMLERIPLALSCCSYSPEKKKCEKIEDHVLKCWIVVRATRPNYVIARSSHSSKAGIVVTCCVVLSVIKWRHLPLECFQTERKLVQLVIVGQLAIVLTGWIAVVIRWLASALYYSSSIDIDYIVALTWDDLRSDLDDLCTLYWRRYRRIDREKRIRDRLRRKEKRIQDAVQKMKASWLRRAMKIGWYLWRPLEIILLYPFKRCLAETGQFCKYKEALDIILLQGEKADQVYISNKWAFDKVNDQLIKGHERGKADSVELITLLKHKTKPASHFEQAGKTCWKDRAVVLIRFMMYCSDGHSDHVVERALKAFNQAREYMDFYESLETNLKLLGREADNEFDKVEKHWKEMEPPKNQRDERKKALEENIKKEREATGENLSLDNIQERENWLKEVENIVKGANAMANLERLLADVLYHCMEKEVQRAIIEKCNKWAMEGREQHIFDIISFTAKAKGVLDEIFTAGPDSTAQSSTATAITIIP